MANIITAIEAQKKNKDRVNIYINDEFAFACSTELVYYNGLKKAMEVQIDKLKEIIKEDNYIKGKNKALKYIEKSIKTETQIREMLIKKEYEEEVIDRVLDFLRNYDFVNDERYVKAFIKAKIKESGKNKIKFNLMKKGISQELIKDSLSAINSEEELLVATRLAQKKADTLCKNEKDKQKILQKINVFLINKGYSYSIINEVIPKIDLTIYIEEENYKEEKDFEELKSIAEKKYTLLKKNEDNMMKLKKKLQDFLLRKGYSYEEIKSVIMNINLENEESNF